MLPCFQQHTLWFLGPGMERPFLRTIFCPYIISGISHISLYLGALPSKALPRIRIHLMYDVYIMGESSVLTLRLDAKLKNQLDRLSKAMSRSRSFVAAQAIQEFVTLNEWQIGEIKKAIAEADRGDFASDKQVQQSLKRWTRRAR
jgi:RHH-type rel operon transcriptional repressor/antitoxin RelB